MNNYGVVIPAIKSRLDNLKLVLEALDSQTYPPKYIIAVCDGFDLTMGQYDELTQLGCDQILPMQKHEPGKTQPRNIGVQFLPEECNYVWFLDSDCVPNENCLGIYDFATFTYPDVSVFIGQYNPEPGRDPRKEFFKQWSGIAKAELSHALACFAGNLVWKIEDFQEVGGFHPNLHMGRCEDGELGLRAAALGKLIMPIAEIKAHHIDHARNQEDKMKKNKRDVPLINEWHPWVKEQGLVLSEKDGARFDRICNSCKQPINSIEWWEHESSCTDETPVNNT